MSKTLVRSLIAGSVSAVASLSLFATTDVAHASGSGCDPIYVDNGDGTAAIAYPDFCDDEADTFPTFPFFPMVPIEVELDIDDLTYLPEPPLPCTPLELSDLEVRAAPDQPRRLAVALLDQRRHHPPVRRHDRSGDARHRRRRGRPRLPDEIGRASCRERV